MTDFSKLEYFIVDPDLSGDSSISFDSDDSNSQFSGERSVYISQKFQLPQETVSQLSNSLQENKTPGSVCSEQVTLKTPNLTKIQVEYQDIAVENSSQTLALFKSQVDRRPIHREIQISQEQGENCYAKDATPDLNTQISCEEIDVSHSDGNLEVFNSQIDISPITVQIDPSPEQTINKIPERDEHTIQPANDGNQRTKSKKRKLASKLFGHKFGKNYHPCHCRTVIRKIKIRDAETQTSPI